MAIRSLTSSYLGCSSLGYHKGQGPQKSRNKRPIGTDHRKVLWRSGAATVGRSSCRPRDTKAAQWTCPSFTSGKQRTKREEDKAYFLLGIFDIHMPLIYGERMKDASSKLREAIDRHPSSQGGKHTNLVYVYYRIYWHVP
jgi:hypothetical protein